MIYCTIMTTNNKKFKTGETREINKCTYKLAFSNTLFVKVQQWLFL
jgi:hypothetical protein